MGLVHESSAPRGTLGSYKHTQASEQETLDLHNVAAAQLKLPWVGRTVVNHRYA